MKDLNQYVAQKNKWNAIFMGDQYFLNSAIDRKQLLRALILTSHQRI